MSDKDCHVCDGIATASAETELLVDEAWSARAVTDVPGWVMLATRRHGDWTWGLSDAEAASFGPVLRRLSDAVRKAANAERVYVMALGENSLHYHLVLLPRSADLAPELRGPALLGSSEALADRAEAQRVAAEIRRELSAW